VLGVFVGTAAGLFAVAEFGGKVVVIEAEHLGLIGGW
jgi:hypothetical protein